MQCGNGFVAPNGQKYVSKKAYISALKREQYRLMNASLFDGETVSNPKLESLGSSGKVIARGGKRKFARPTQPKRWAQN